MGALETASPPQARPEPIRRISPADRVVFGPSFETLYRACGAKPPPEIQQVFRDAGVDFNRLQVAYPLETYLKVMAGVRRTLYRELPDEDAFFRIGRGFVDRFSSTVIGKAVMLMLPVLGPKRVLGRLTQSFRTANNYSEVVTTELAPGHHLIHAWPVIYTGFYRGILTAGLEVAGAKGLTVTLVSHREEEAVYEMRWTL